MLLNLCWIRWAQIFLNHECKWGLVGGLGTSSDGVLCREILLFNSKNTIEPPCLCLCSWPCPQIFAGPTGEVSWLDLGSDLPIRRLWDHPRLQAGWNWSFAQILLLCEGLVFADTILKSQIGLAFPRLYLWLQIRQSDGTLMERQAETCSSQWERDYEGEWTQRCHRYCQLFM